MSEERYTLVAYQQNTPAGNDSNCHTWTPLTKMELLEHIIDYTNMNVESASSPLNASWDLRILKGSMVYVGYEERQNLYAAAYDLALMRKM